MVSIKKERKKKQLVGQHLNTYLFLHRKVIVKGIVSRSRMAFTIST